jgi:hypothetical protein
MSNKPTSNKPTSNKPKFHKQTTVTLTTNMEESRKIPSLDIKLSGPSTYSEWVISIETHLNLIPIGRTEDYRV